MKIKKTNTQLAAEVVWKFCVPENKAGNPALHTVLHDKEGKIVVACDNKRLIATKHGFNPLVVHPMGDSAFPNWKQVTPDLDKTPHQKIFISTAKLREVCKATCKLGKAMEKISLDGGGDVLVWFKLEDGKVAALAANQLEDVLEAMEYNYIDELCFIDPDSPVVARNEQTTIVLMPVRWSWYGRPDSNQLRHAQRCGRLFINGLTCRLESPEQADWREAAEEYEASEAKRKQEARRRMVQEATDRLEPCHCGGKPELRCRVNFEQDGEEWAAVCESCRTWTVWKPTAFEAVEAWNEAEKAEKAKLAEDHARFEEWQEEQRKANLAEAVAV